MGDIVGMLSLFYIVCSGSSILQRKTIQISGPYCGNTAPSSFTIPSNHVIVEFNADKSDSYAGFKANWKAV